MNTIITTVNDDERDDEITMFVVISDIDGGAYGPFHARKTALEYAAAVDGTVFKCVDAE